MSNETLSAEELGNKLLQSVKEMKAGFAEKDQEKIIQNARNYCQLLQEHIHKEDNILYPMANEALNLNNQTLMAEEFVKVEEKMSEIKEKCLNFLGEQK